MTDNKPDQVSIGKILGNVRRAERLVKLGTYEWDWESHRLLTCSEEYARIHEMSVDEALQFFSSDEVDFSYIHPDDRERIRAVEMEAQEKDGSFTAEYRMQLPSGRICYIREICEGIRDQKGKLTTTVGTLQDVTEFKLVEEKLSRALADAQRTQRLVQLGTYEWDEKEHRLVACSEEYARLFEMSVEEALRTFDSVEADLESVHPDDREAVAALGFDEAAKAEGYRSSYRLLLPSGRIRHIREAFSFIFDDHGEIVSTSGSLQDVTEQVLLEDQLRQTQKIEAVGQLAGGIAHEFNNLLTAINMHNGLLLQELEAGDPRHHNLSQIKIASDRAAVLTRQILAFGRQQMLQPKVINLGEIASDMADMLRHLLGDEVELQIRQAPGLKLVKADPGQLQQVIMNLLINAGDAMPTGGKIIINIENVTVNDGDSSKFGDLSAGAYVELSVSDTGVGMSVETKSHIFEPFYTTKEIGQGSGLGLSTVFGIIKQSGGDIGVESEPDQGSTFRVYLPQSKEAKPVAQTKPHSSAGHSGSETILLVEDNGLIRKMLDNNLQRLGYTVLVARNGKDAISVAADHEGGIDLMVTDVVMPEMGGHELAQKLTASRPEVSVLYMSGYDEKTVADHGRVGNNFLQKPFDAHEVNDKIREILDADES